ncbi:M28 family metallopeptidase [Pleionea sediminis]|uniref:M28 family metallopeptidase n=1 Tax=Pleionea sediminis TaxID=2569479 RepID=UPI001186FBCD|nr:M28 family metallopeptidase [Pleionea sediminis]
MRNTISLIAIQILVLATSLILAGCKEPNISIKEQSSIPEVNQNSLRAHISFLADDSLKGRATGSEGYNIAAKYVASHFQQYGLKPAGSGDSYLQPIQFRERQLNIEATKLTFNKSSTINLQLPDDFVTRGNEVASEQKLTAPLVFIGYGIKAPDFSHNDYETIDVTGKIVVIMLGKPASFASEKGAHLANVRERARAAAKHGAVGVLLLHTPAAEKRYPYERIKKTLNSHSIDWLDENGIPGNSIPELKGSALLSQTAASLLLSDSEYTFESLLEKIEKDEPLPKFDLDFTATIQTQTKFKNITSYNVAGFIEGSDPELKHEYILYTAHLDHLGEYHSLEPLESEKDIIHNGALDNASGTAIMLETARLFSTNPPKRSILFLAVTAEEKGLLGSDFYAKNPTVPIDQIVANINLDMPLILYPIGDVIAFGSEHSTMEDFVQKAAETVNLQLSPDPMPEQNIFTRSDHYSFVKQGIPAVFLVPGFKSLDDSVNGEEMFQKFFAEHYHQPSDESSLPINYEAGAVFTQVNYLIGKEIGNSKERPRWHEGNFFGETFAKEN